jgi:O-antigen biosynthesis protein
LLRLAIYYESRLGRNDGNPLYVWASLKRMQEKGLVDVDHLAPTGDLAQFGKYDAHVWVDWGEDGLRGILPYEPIFPPGKPLVYWASDTHLGYDYRLQCAKQADIAFFAQKRGVEDAKRDGVANPLWLPHAVEPIAYPKFDLASKQYDVCFVGHINSGNRVNALDKLFKTYPNFYYGQRLFEEASRKYAESKIVFNISMVDDLNMRTFEAMASGSMLMTNWIPTIEEHFEDGKHLVLYRNDDEMVEKARYYLEHDEERERIAQAGYEEVMKNHTIDKRVETMLSAIKEMNYASVPVS